MSEWQVTLLIIGGGLLFTIYTAWMIGLITDEYIQSKRVKEFEKDFEAAIQHSQPNWEEMKEIARTNNLSQTKVLRVFHKAMKKILTGEAKEIEPHKDIIRSYIDKYNEEEPFEGMPSDIRIHLERLREKIDDKAGLLDPLTNQIKDLLSINERERRHQKYYTMGGFFVGIIGLMFAAYGFYFSSVSQEIPIQEVSTTQVEQGTTANNQVNKDASR